jgi:hypothetical protein
MRLRSDAIPVPVPRQGAGKTSGVYAYSTPYIMFWEKSVWSVQAYHEEAACLEECFDRGADHLVVRIIGNDEQI